MGFLLKALGVGLAVAGVKKIKHNIEEENRRKNTVCRFDGGISKEEFYVMVKRGGKGIRRITSLYAEETMVYGTVRSQSGISDWRARGYTLSTQRTPIQSQSIKTPSAIILQRANVCLRNREYHRFQQCNSIQIIILPCVCKGG